MLETVAEKFLINLLEMGTKKVSFEFSHANGLGESIRVWIRGTPVGTMFQEEELLRRSAGCGVIPVGPDYFLFLCFHCHGCFCT